uniref:Putative methyltransferase n=1 Tax=viral metagenome TaxID=1070528 RepID=A0A6M3M6T0_9ZZZZ
MAFPTWKLRTVLPVLFPDSVGLLLEPPEAKLNLGAGLGEGADEEFTNVDRGYQQAFHRTVQEGKLLVKADIRDLSGVFEPGSAAIVYTHHVLEHIPHSQAKAVLKHWVSLLRPGGLLYVCVPDILWAIACAIRGPTWQTVSPERRWAGPPISWEQVNGLIYQGSDHLAAWWSSALIGAMAEAGLDPVREWKGDRTKTASFLPSCETTVIGRKKAG